MYRHNQNHSRHISLHDCRAERMTLENGVLSLIFPDGIWVTPEHEENAKCGAYRRSAGGLHDSG